MIQNEQLKELINKYQAGECSDEEVAVLENWYLQWNEADRVSLSEDELIRAQERSLQKLEPIFIPERNIKLWPRIAAAAAILLVLGSGLFFYNHYTNTPRHLEGSAATRDLLANDIKPGTNKATLTLSDGSTITLTDAANGALAQQSGVQITKTANGQLIYSALSLSPQGRDAEGSEGEENLNTISTPRGGQYQVRLPDGTKVWLNAASKLIYPVSFNGRKDRRVELNGEAYFEVAKDKAHPFLVNSNGQEVQVLGTHFNINSYADEGSVKTTLLEGRVLVSGVILKPGEQASFQSNKIKVTQVNTELAIAWKNGFFNFKNTPLQIIMRQIGRWYDVEVAYSNAELKETTISGAVSRYDKVSAVLNILEQTGAAKFRIEGKKIIVLEYNQQK